MKGMNKKIQAYNDFISQLELVDIAMESGQFKQKRSFVPKVKCQIKVRGNVLNWNTFKNNDTIFRYKSEIIIKQKNRILFETKCIFALLFKTPTKFSKKYYEEFVENSNHLDAFVWPYIRQWFAEVTERAVLPRFTAPLVKSLVKSPIPKIKKKKK